jgi:DNA-binding Lrp family transcriptional regulator
MDRLDLGILRELSRDQVVWFGRLDPRLSAAAVARQLRVHRATVSSRLRRWEQQGFLLGHEVVPSPLVFGAGIAGGNLRAENVGSKRRLLEDLALVPGLISAVDHVGPWIALLYAYETTDGLDRSRRLVSRLEGSGEVSPCVPFRAAEPTVALSALDWRILRELRREPRRTLTEVAHAVAVSSKTLVRRMERLVGGRAVWYLPLLDFSRYTHATMVRFIVTLRANADVNAASEAVTHAVPGLTFLVDTAHLVASSAAMPSILDVGACVPSVGHAEDVQTELGSLDSVQEVEVLFPRRFYLYPGWFDDRIALALTRERQSSRSGLRARPR